jgi:hypothetical protein
MESGTSESIWELKLNIERWMFFRLLSEFGKIEVVFEFLGFRIKAVFRVWIFRSLASHQAFSCFTRTNPLSNA